MPSSAEPPKWSPSADLSFDEDDDDWQEMPVIRSNNAVLDEEDRKRFRYLSPQLSRNNGNSARTDVGSSNATGNLLELSEAAASRGEDWREKSNQLEESNYTRLGLDDDPDEDSLNLRTQYLFDDNREMTPLNQLQATKNLLNEAQRIAYVGMCRLVMKEMLDALKRGGHSEVDPSIDSMKDWSSKILGRLYQHMDVEAREQQMIEQLAEHGVSSEDLVGTLITTHTIPNPNYDPKAVPEDENESGESDQQSSLNDINNPGFPRSSSDGSGNAWTAEASKIGASGLIEAVQSRPVFQQSLDSNGFDESTTSGPWATSAEILKSINLSEEPPPYHNQSTSASSIDESKKDIEASSPTNSLETPKATKTSFELKPPPLTPASSSADLPASMPHTLPGVSTTVTPCDKNITLDIRWTVLCDLFLALIADSIYDSRSRVLLGRCAYKLRLSWMDVVRFERRLTEALEVQEGITKESNADVIEEHDRKSKTKRLVMMGAATLGGGLVIGLSAGLLAPVIGAGLAAGFTTIGIGGTSGFLAGAGGAAVITTAGTVTGMNIGGKGMSKRTQSIKTFQILPLHNNGRVNVFLTMPGFMEGANDDVRLPFSVMDQSMGDVLSVLWEPEMMGETGNIIKILTSEVLTQVGQQVLQATVLTALMSALQWPLMLTKLGYLIDNPWSNALDRARAAGAVLADVLIKRHVGVRPVSLIGFSLGARAIFYALVELAKKKAYGIVQEVYLLGATVTAPVKTWREVRGIVAGRFVNGYCKKDWILGYLYRATTGGLQTVAGLSPVDSVPDMENVDLTELVIGHMSYRAQMPVILAELGLKVTADHFDEPESMQEDDQEEEAPVRLKTVKEAEEKKRMIFNFTRKNLKNNRPQSLNLSSSTSTTVVKKNDDESPPRLDHPQSRASSLSGRPSKRQSDMEPNQPLSAGAADELGHRNAHQINTSTTEPGEELFDVRAIKRELSNATVENMNDTETIAKAEISSWSDPWRS